MKELLKMPAPNKPVAIMAADVKIQTSVLRKTLVIIQTRMTLDPATIATAKPLEAGMQQCIQEATA